MTVRAAGDRRGAVVTGAGRGLGKEIARHLVAEGYAVLVTDVDLALAQAAAVELGCEAAALDVRDGAQVEAVASGVVAS
ncbi:SDR family NAD(P)-dependent oxidoreductase, partial [Nocardioides sp. GCM10030258]